MSQCFIHYFTKSALSSYHNPMIFKILQIWEKMLPQKKLTNEPNAFSDKLVIIVVILF